MAGESGPIPDPRTGPGEVTQESVPPAAGFGAQPLETSPITAADTRPPGVADPAAQVGSMASAGPELDEAVFTTLSPDDMARAVRRSIELANHDMAGQRIAFMRAKFGDTPRVLDLAARLQFRLGQHHEAYASAKKIYFEHPAFLLEHDAYSEISRGVFDERLARAQAAVQKASGMVQRLAPPGSGPMPGANSTEQENRRAAFRGFEEAMGAYQEILAIEPMHRDALKGLILACRDLQRQNDLEQYQQMLMRSGGYWSTLYEQRNARLLAAAVEKLDAGAPADAIPLINLGLDHSEDHKGLLLAKARALMAIDRPQEAESCVDALLRFHEGDPDGTMLKRDMQRNKINNLMKLARSQLDQAETGDLGQLQTRACTRKALDALYEVLNLDANNVDALTMVYRCHELASDPSRAAKTLERIKEIDEGFKVERLLKGPAHPPIREGGGCFVATRLFGRNSVEVQTLCRFRARCLLPTWWGRALVHGYGWLSPRLIRWVLPGSSLERWLRRRVRAIVRAVARREQAAG